MGELRYEGCHRELSMRRRVSHSEFIPLRQWRGMTHDSQLFAAWHINTHFKPIGKG